MKRKLLSIAAALLFVAGAKAQTSYGLKAGVNLAKFKVSQGNVNYTSDANTSFYITGFADMPVAPNFSIQPGVSLQGKGGKVSAGEFDLNEDAKDNLMYIEVPVNLVYYFPTGDAGKVFLGAGPYAGFGVHAKASKGNYSESGSFGDAGIKTFDAGLNLLGGYKLTNGFLINVGYGLGLTNMYKDIEGVTSKNRVFSLGVGYQF
ncbi:porin family protein [uncultured Sphingobacterium sp.]|uniref:porin family protein n=1 Tax=uncultured Sphingobacterium sp. TaxID=182688 RepID=UPI0025D74EC2|nr:porin family protein [uncultured Sphingobacterium sp.]